MSPNLSSAAVVIGALRVNSIIMCRTAGKKGSGAFVSQNDIDSTWKCYI